MGWGTKGLALNSLALLSPSWPWEREAPGWNQGNWRPPHLQGWIKATLGAGLLVWAGRRGRGAQLRHRHFKNLLLFHLNSLPPKPVPPRTAFPLCNQGPRICAPLCWKEGSRWRGRGMPAPRPWGRGTYGAGPGWGAEPPGLVARSSDNDAAPRTASVPALGQGLYDHVLISCPLRSGKTAFMISPIFPMKRLRPSLLPLPHPADSQPHRANGQGRDGGAAG